MIEWHRTCKKPPFVEIRTTDDESSSMEVYSNGEEPTFYLKMEIKFCPWCGRELNKDETT